MNIYEFASCRCREVASKPFDTLARIRYDHLDHETFKDAAGKRQPAIRWLLDVIADPKKPQSTESSASSIWGPDALA